MKRNLDEEKNRELEGLPDIITVLVQFVDIKTVDRIAALLSVCKAFYTQRKIMIQRWCEFIIFDVFTMGGQDTDESTLLNNWLTKKTGDREWYVKLVTNNDSNDYSDDLFNAQKCAILRKWFRTETRVMKFQQYRFQELKDLSFHDPVSNEVIPLLHLPGLKVVREKKAYVMQEELKKWLVTDENDIKGKMATEIISKLHLQQLAYYHYQQQKNLGLSVEELPPTGDRLIYDVILNGRHLYSRHESTEIVLNNLYICVTPRELSCRNHILCQANLVRHWLDYQSIKVGITLRLRLIPPDEGDII